MPHRGGPRARRQRVHLLGGDSHLVYLAALSLATPAPVPIRPSQGTPQKASCGRVLPRFLRSTCAAAARSPVIVRHFCPLLPGPRCTRSQLDRIQQVQCKAFPRCGSRFICGAVPGHGTFVPSAPATSRHRSAPAHRTRQKMLLACAAATSRRGNRHVSAMLQRRARPWAQASTDTQAPPANDRRAAPCSVE